MKNKKILFSIIADTLPFLYTSATDRLVLNLSTNLLDLNYIREHSLATFRAGTHCPRKNSRSTARSEFKQSLRQTPR